MGLWSKLFGRDEEPSNEALEMIEELKQELLDAIGVLEKIEGEEMEQFEEFRDEELNKQELIEHLEHIRHEHLRSFIHNMRQIGENWNKLEGRENWPQDGSIQVIRLWRGDGPETSDNPPRERAKFVEDRLKEYADEVYEIDEKIKNLGQQDQSVSRDDLEQVTKKAEKTFIKFKQDEDDLAGYLDFSKLEKQYYD